MPLKGYQGPSVAALLALVRADLGADAVIVKVERRDDGLELFAADPETAALLARMGGVAGLRGVRGRGAGGFDASAAVGASELTAPRPGGPAAPLYLAFVGPTGAGKTTTVAKLAAHPHAFRGRRVGLLNLDTYRVGASAQLEMHAALEGLPVASVHDPDDLDEALALLRHCDVVLIDCPGRGPRVQHDLGMVAEVLGALPVAEVHVALPAGLQATMVRRLIAQFEPLGVTHLLPTKVDEMPDDWTVFDIAAAMQLPMRWLADGQRVPHDLRSAVPRLEAARAGRRAARRRGA